MSSRASTVRDVVADVLGVELPDEETDLIASGLLDSMSLVSLVAELEERLDIELPFATLDIDDFRSLRALTSLVSRVREVA